ncbi:hypothetical protein C6P45_004279 [Maudiozyma exigua]|uniref:C2H2-type domain-containing protein n=1 Tax=Maudiozyma exigua TaxID=34358 RepID=A0A9P6WBB7_MAUEX|nr:hypothetical protein C6P45_004279 [Kazachstania exigua]
MKENEIIDGKLTSVNNNMNARVNKQLNYLPTNLRLNGVTPSGKPRLFVCKICTRAFARQEHLDRHERSHTNEKPYNCGICDKKFSRRDLLLRHAQKVHGGNCGDNVKRKIFNRRQNSNIKNNDINSDRSISDNNDKRRTSKSVGKNSMVQRRKSEQINSTKENNNDSYNVIGSNNRKKSIVANLLSTATLSSPERPNSSSNSDSSSNIGSPFITEITARTTPFSNSPANVLSLFSPTYSLGQRPNSNGTPTSSRKPIFKEPSYLTPSNGRGRKKGSRKTATSPTDQIGKKTNRKKTSNQKKLKSHPLTRRASFSAQSAENYATPLFKTDEYQYERVQFSTPDLLPIDFRNYWNQTLPNGNWNIDDVDVMNLNATGIDTLGAAPLSTINNSQEVPPEFCLTDAVNYINNDDINVQSSSFGNSSDTISDSKLENGFSQEQLNFKNAILTARTPGSISSASGSTPGSASVNGLGLAVDSVGSAFTTQQVKDGDNNNSTITGFDDNINLLSNTSTVDLFNQQIISEGDTSNNELNSDNTSPNRIYDVLMSISSSLPQKDLYQNDPTYIGNFINFNSDPILDPSITQNLFHDSTIIEAKDEDHRTNSSNTTLSDPLSIIKTIQNDNLISNIDNFENNGYTFYGADSLNLTSISKATSGSVNNEHHEQIPITCSLFTETLRDYCHQVLAHYNIHCKDKVTPMLNQKLPVFPENLTVPSSNEMNTYLMLFETHFLRHYPFVHPSVLRLDFTSFLKYLQEDENLTPEEINHMKNQNISLFASRVICLPLLMATFGSLFKNGYSLGTLSLFEISRRCIQVYLECKKRDYQEKVKIQEGNKTADISEPSQNTWLIQVLLLNIIFGFFADESHHMNNQVVKRQVSAVCSIIRKNVLKLVYAGYTSSSNQRFKFRSQSEYILFETKIRCVLLIYRYCQYLKIFYNIESPIFLQEKDIEQLCIPDRENKWLSYSLININHSSDNELPVLSIEKQNSVPFIFFYDSFSFNERGLHAIPEDLAGTMLYYEYNTRSTSSFHIFLTRIDTKKLELNLPKLKQKANGYQLKDKNSSHYDRSIDNPSDLGRDMVDDSEALVMDSILLKNCLMVMQFFEVVSSHINLNISTSSITTIYSSFLNSENMNILKEGSSSLLTDFLVALNFSIQNIARLSVFDNVTNHVELDDELFSIFNFQGIYYNFLVIIKFILDFEETPNFKLLSIFAELNKLATNVLLPKLALIYPREFTRFEELNINSDTFDGMIGHSANLDKGSSKVMNVDRISKIINDVIVYSFNDASFLNMADQANNEFLFEHNQGPKTLFAFRDHQTTGNVNTDHDTTNSSENSSTDQIMDGSYTHVSIQERDVKKQSFSLRYHLSLKYAIIAKCLFASIIESHIEYSLLTKMINDFSELEKTLSLKMNEKVLSKFHIAP